MKVKKVISRRDLLKAGCAIGTGAELLGLGGLNKAQAAKADERLCVAVCNHWSYIGIGWQLGIESNVLSVIDAMEVADRPPHAKTSINLDARAYELIAEQFPEIAARLKGYLAAGRLELIGGTYGQPMGTTISGEANIRQVVVGRETIRRALDYEMVTFLEEEEFSHPQVPQIAAGAGYRYTALTQLDTWGRAGCPFFDENTIRWKGIDGTALPCISRNALSWGMYHRLRDFKKEIVDSADFKKLQSLGVPLLCCWEEFGWESPEHPDYLDTPGRYQAWVDQYPIEFVTLQEYMAKYGVDPKETVFFPMDAWDKSLTWGLGGDQVRIFNRKVEGTLLAAELFDAVAAGLGATSQVERLGQAWKDLMASQSHDVGLCEYSRWQLNRIAVLDRLEDHHNFTWGAMGFQHLDKAHEQGKAVLDAAVGSLAGQVNSVDNAQGQLAVTVFNPQGWDRTDWASTGRVYPLPAKTRDLIVRDRSGRRLPSQVIKCTQDGQGNWAAGEVAFLASSVPSAGYDTYYLEPTLEPQSAVKSTLVVDESGLTMENEYLRVSLDPVTGGVASLVHKPSGRETLDGKLGAFPHFTGRPNPNLSLRPSPPERYDSVGSKGQLDWVAQGPVFATVRAQHKWKYLYFETRVTLAAGRPYVEVVSRVFAELPPHSDAAPADIKEGYWISFTPAFEVSDVWRDYPLAVEKTEKDAFHALTFADFVGKDRGLLVLHPGTQWFTRNEEGVVSNLLMREWESHFTREYGWPPYAEYRHALLPHAADLSNAERLRTAAEHTQPMLSRVGAPHRGSLPPFQSFIKLAPDGLQLSAFRSKPAHGFELRVVETEGRSAKATVELGLPIATAVETDLLGRKTGAVSHRDGRLSFSIKPWKIRTFEVT